MLKKTKTKNKKQKKKTLPPEDFNFAFQDDWSTFFL